MHGSFHFQSRGSYSNASVRCVRRKGEEAAAFYVAAAVGDWLWLAWLLWNILFGLPSTGSPSVRTCTQP